MLLYAIKGHAHVLQRTYPRHNRGQKKTGAGSFVCFFASPFRCFSLSTIRFRGCNEFGEASRNRIMALLLFRPADRPISAPFTCSLFVFIFFFLSQSLVGRCQLLVTLFTLCMGQNDSPAPRSRLCWQTVQLELCFPTKRLPDP